MKHYKNVTPKNAPRGSLSWYVEYGVVFTIVAPQELDFTQIDIADMLDHWKENWEEHKNDEALQKMYKMVKLLNLSYKIKPLPPDVPSEYTDVNTTAFPLSLTVYIRAKFIGSIFEAVSYRDLINKLFQSVEKYLHPYSFIIDDFVIGKATDLDAFETALALGTPTAGVSFSHALTAPLLALSALMLYLWGVIR